MTVRGIQKGGAWVSERRCGDLPSEWGNAKIGKAVLPNLIRHLVRGIWITSVVYGFWIKFRMTVRGVQN